MTTLTTEKASEDLKNLLIELMAKVPGKNKKISPKARRFYSDVLAYAGTTEFDGQTVLFTAKASQQMNEDGNLVYQLGIEPITEYCSSNEIETLFGDHDFPEDDHAWYDLITDETRRKLAKYNAYDADTCLDDTEYSFFYHRFNDTATPRLVWFTDALSDIELDKSMTYEFTPENNTFGLPDLTPDEVKKAEQVGPDVELPYDVTAKQEDAFVEKATKAFLHDLKRIYHKVPDKLAPVFNVTWCFADEYYEDSLDVLCPVEYANGNSAIVFKESIPDEHKNKVEIYNEDGELVGTDTIRLLSDLYELRYGLLKVAAKQNKDLIDQLTKQYTEDATLSEDSELEDKVHSVADINLDKLTD